MSGNQNRQLNKSLGIQLFVTIIIFVVAVSSSLLGYVESYKAKARTQVYEDMASVVDEYANNVMIGIKDCVDISNVIASLLSVNDSRGEAMGEAIGSLFSLGYVEDIFIADIDGLARGMKGEEIDFSSAGFWLNIDKSLDTQIIPSISEDFGNRLMVVTSAEENGTPCYVIICYSFDRIMESIKTSDLGTRTAFMIVGRNGDVLCVNNVNSQFTDLSNILDVIDASDTEQKNIKDGIVNGKKIYANIELDSEGRTVINIPIGNYPVNMLVAIDNSHVAFRMKQETQQVVDLERIVFVCIACLMIAIAIIFSKHRLRINDNKQQLEEKADTDLLTGLNNKIATERKIREYIETHPDETGMFIIFDIDKFKKINDTQGHAFGDEVLRTLGERISGQFRVTDIVGRIGGDEFMIYLKNIPSEEIAKKEAEKLMLFFQDFKAGSEYIKYSATASVGVAMYPEDGTNFEQLYKAADDALYYSKDNGRNQLNFHNSEWGTIKK